MESGQGIGAKIDAALGCGFHGKAVSNRKQTAVGSQLNWFRTLLPSVWVPRIERPEPVWKIPGDKYFAGGAADGRVCLCPEGAWFTLMRGQGWDKG